jgi:hypothetical protein
MREYWTLEDLNNLDPLEHDFQEFKSSAFLIREDDTLSSEFIYKFSKQISAFANAQGGRIFLGIRDDAHIDEGIPIDIKSGGTKPWLENLIQDIVSPRLQQYNVFEVQISSERAVYIIDVSASKQGPHQAKDQRYYLRISGMSRPMGHIHVEDVFRRNRTPNMKLKRLAPYETPQVVQTEQGIEVLQAFRIHLSNVGNSMAQHVGGEVSIPRTLMTKRARQKTQEEQKIHYTQKPSEMAFFHYLGIPIFPSQEVYFMVFWVGVTKKNVHHLQQGQFIRTRIYADDAEPKEDIIDLSSNAQFRDIAILDIWGK